LVLLAALVGLQLVIGILTAVVFSVKHLGDVPLAVAVGAGLAFGIVLLVGLRRARAPAREVFALRPVPYAVLVAVAVSVVGLLIIFAEIDNLGRFLLPTSTPSGEFMMRLIRGDFWAALIGAVVVAPVTEEMFFRGLVLRGLLSRYRVRTAMIVSAVLFAVPHLDLRALPVIFAIGLLFAWCVVRTGSLFPGLVGHAVHNLVVTLAVTWQGPVIPGFTGPPSPLATFQPLAFDLLGLALTILGFWWLTHLFRRRDPWEHVQVEIDSFQLGDTSAR
jgi:hypothetical protein